jgi:hypothetical protein
VLTPPFIFSECQIAPQKKLIFSEMFFNKSRSSRQMIADTPTITPHQIPQPAVHEQPTIACSARVDIIAKRRGRPPKYATDEERLEAKRQQARESYQRRKATKAEPNGPRVTYTTEAERLEAKRKYNRERYLLKRYGSAEAYFEAKRQRAHEQHLRFKDAKERLEKEAFEQIYGELYANLAHESENKVPTVEELVSYIKIRSDKIIRLT